MLHITVNCWVKLKQFVSQKRRDVLIHNVLLLHNNATPYTVAITQEKLQQLHWVAVEHPPYKPQFVTK